LKGEKEMIKQIRIFWCKTHELVDRAKKIYYSMKLKKLEFTFYRLEKEKEQIEYEILEIQSKLGFQISGNGVESE